MAAIALDTPLAETLSGSIQNRIVQEGWAQDDDTALAEYIVLMIANGKTQSQILSELQTELLPEAQGTDVFSQWLFDEIAQVTGTGSSAPAPSISEDAPMVSAETKDESATPSIPAAYENDMVEAPPDNAYDHASNARFAKANFQNSPKGPRSSQNSRGGRGARGSQGKGPDAVLHRVRGNDRINSHNVRGAPKGPRNLQNRPGMQKALNGLTGGGPGGMPAMAQNGGAGQGQNMAFNAEQQMQYLQMMEQQARLMAQWNEMQQGMNGGGQPRSLADRIESGRGRGGMRGRGRGGFQQNGSRNGSTTNSEAKTGGDGDSNMEGVDQGAQEPSDPATIMCRFNTRCTNKECPYAHQSPAAPMNIPVDTSQVCQFGIACKNVQCTARHPSPALKAAYQGESECKFWPNCTKTNCPFKHPTASLCSFGASCNNPNCKFTHLTTPCKFNPCTNARCPFKHAPGQNRTMNDYTWTPELQKQRDEQKQEEPQEPQHVSDRKFVVEAGEEELIKPNGEEAEKPAEAAAVTVDDTIT